MVPGGDRLLPAIEVTDSNSGALGFDFTDQNENSTFEYGADIPLDGVVVVIAGAIKGALPATPLKLVTVTPSTTMPE